MPAKTDVLVTIWEVDDDLKLKNTYRKRYSCEGLPFDWFSWRVTAGRTHGSLRGGGGRFRQERDDAESPRSRNLPMRRYSPPGSFQSSTTKFRTAKYCLASVQLPRRASPARAANFAKRAMVYLCEYSVWINSPAPQ
jgi:hypothetical protein